MTYTPEVWGEIIANGIEEAGGAGGGGATWLLTEYNDDDDAYSDVNMTASEIVAAIQEGKQVGLISRYTTDQSNYIDNYYYFAIVEIVNGEVSYCAFEQTGAAPLYVVGAGKVTETEPGA